MADVKQLAEQLVALTVKEVQELADFMNGSVPGLALTAVFNIRGVPEPSGNLLAAWFANPATSSLSIDLLVTASAASIFIILEGRRLGIRWPWLYVIASFITAVAFTFPLFLAVRERHLDHGEERR